MKTKLVRVDPSTLKIGDSFFFDNKNNFLLGEHYYGSEACVLMGASHHCQGTHLYPWCTREAWNDYVNGGRRLGNPVYFDGNKAWIYRIVEEEQYFYYYRWSYEDEDGINRVAESCIESNMPPAAFLSNLIAENLLAFRRFFSREEMEDYEKAHDQVEALHRELGTYIHLTK